MLRELPLLRSAVDFNLFLRPEYQPAFLHAGVGVGAELGTVVVVAAHTNLDHEFGGAGMCGRIVVDGAADDREVRLRLRITTLDGLTA